MKAKKQKMAFLIYKVDINNTEFDRILIGIKSGHYCDDFDGVFAFNLEEISINAFIATIKMHTKVSDSVILIYETKNGKYDSKKVR